MDFAESGSLGSKVSVKFTARHEDPCVGGAINQDIHMGAFSYHSPLSA